MASSEADSRLAEVVIPALEKIIKSASWRKHSKLAAECKSVIDHLNSSSAISTSTSDQPDRAAASSHPGVLLDLALSDSELILNPIINALSSKNLKVSEPALDAVQSLVSRGYLRGEADPAGSPDAKLLANLIDTVSKCHGLGAESVELQVIKALLSAVTSVSMRIHGDCLLQIVRTFYDIYLSSKNVVNQNTAKASLVQLLVIVFRRMEADSSTVPLQPILVAEVMETTEKADTDGSMTNFVQGFISKVMQDIDGVFSPAISKAVGSGAGAHDGAFETKISTIEGANAADLLDSTDKDMLDAKYWEINMYKTAFEGKKGVLVDGEGEGNDDFVVKLNRH